MLGSEVVIAFVPTRDLAKARAFYQDVLGLAFLAEDGFAVLLEANGARVRIAHVAEFTPQPFTVLGWAVTDIGQTVTDLMEKGIEFNVYDEMEQDSLRIWTAPSGARVAWFKDPDGNVLSVAQPADCRS